MEREQYEWMQDFLFDIYKAHPPEDEIMMQYINVGLSKSAAVVGLVSTNTQIPLPMPTSKNMDLPQKSTHSYFIEIHHYSNFLDSNIYSGQTSRLFVEGVNRVVQV